MKLSEMNTERAMDVMCNIAVPLTEIATDKQVIAFLKETSTDRFKRQMLIESIGEAITKLTPILFRTHRDGLYTIICEMTGKTKEEVMAQNVMTTLADVKEFADKDFIDFFTSFKA